jgi:hypothetical protein
VVIRDAEVEEEERGGKVVDAEGDVREVGNADDGGDGSFLWPARGTVNKREEGKNERCRRSRVNPLSAAYPLRRT